MERKWIAGLTERWEGGGALDVVEVPRFNNIAKVHQGGADPFPPLVPLTTLPLVRPYPRRGWHEKRGGSGRVAVSERGTGGSRKSGLGRVVDVFGGVGVHDKKVTICGTEVLSKR